MRVVTVLFFCLFVPTALAVQDAASSIQFQTTDRQIPLLELYTSEGCSSCPPADEWLSGLVADPRLWKDMVPIAFHVDYWNYIGWQDPFSKTVHSERQRSHAEHGNIKSVYTPGFILNGQEWRAWIKRPQWDSATAPEVGRLTVTISDGQVSAEFLPTQTQAATLQLNYAWLGFELVSVVKAGENKGRTLRHDFVSQDWQQHEGQRREGQQIEGKKRGDSYRWHFALSANEQLAQKQGVAFWISDPANPKPIQATGGWYSAK